MVSEPLNRLIDQKNITYVICNRKKRQRIHFKLYLITDFVKPVCLPYEDNVREDYHFMKNGEKLESWVAGWGATDPRGKNILKYEYFKRY